VTVYSVYGLAKWPYRITYSKHKHKWIISWIQLECYFVCTVDCKSMSTWWKFQLANTKRRDVTRRQTVTFVTVTVPVSTGCQTPAGNILALHEVRGRTLSYIQQFLLYCPEERNSKSTQTSVTNYQSTRCYITQQCILQTQFPISKQ